jgi:hypothetical protein
MSEYESPAAPNDPPPQQARWGVIGFAIATIGMGLLYRTIKGLGFTHTSLMFIGIPSVLAILLAMTPRAKSTTGAIMKGLTLALLLTAPLLGEGFLCILMASPLFYFVGAIVAAIADWQRNRRGTTLSCCAILLLPLSLEGVVPQLTFKRSQTVEVTRIVDATPAQIEASLAHSPRVDTRLPRFLAIGFPHPLEAHGEGLTAGSTRTVHFSGAEGDPPGDLVARIAEVRPGYIRTETVSDSSKLTQWLEWDSSEVAWHPIDATHTAVTWRIHFQRNLDPAWYFAPWERFAVREAAAYMIQSNATPPGLQ